MVNFFPEDPIFPLNSTPFLKLYPCKTTIKDSGVAVDFSMLAIGEAEKEHTKDRGVLDAHSKHFMLAQGIGTTFRGYTRLTQSIDLTNVLNHPWVTASGIAKKVEYAGEIIVDIQGCKYFINQGSGTYRPEAGDNLENLLAVAEVFRTTLGFPPTSVWEVPDKFLPVNQESYNKQTPYKRKNPVCP
jgi:hypothetical protein